MERFTFANGETWVHSPDKCAGEYCVIHNPSLHLMIEEKMVLCADTSVVRLCRHGGLHPDPDSAFYLMTLDPNYEPIHHCCMYTCCQRIPQHGVLTSSED